MQHSSDQDRFSTSAIANNSRHYLSGESPSSRICSSFKWENVMPSYLKALPSCTSINEFESLSQSGALSLPDPFLRDKLLQSYVRHVHGFMPVIELRTLALINRDDGCHDSQISPLLFQSLMFSGIAFIDIHHLQIAGFQSRKEARREFFRRVQLLYDLHDEDDPISLLQSLLLMTFWYGAHPDQKETWHWMGLASSLLRLTGLDSSLTAISKDINTQRLWKRIGWSCFVRDQVVSLSLQCPPRLKRDDFHLPMLSLEDFELDPINMEASNTTLDTIVSFDATELRVLAKTFIEKAKLSLCVGHILHTQYTILDRVPCQAVTHNFTLVPKTRNRNTQQVIECRAELDAWLSGLAQEARFRPIPARLDTENQKSIIVHRALLHMLYFTAISTLYRPMSIDPHPSSSLRLFGQAQSRKEIFLAAMEITNVAQNLSQLNLLRFLPTWAVAVLLPAIMAHLPGTRSPDLQIRDASFNNLGKCMYVLNYLRDVYTSADIVSQLVETAMSKPYVIEETSRVDHLHGQTSTRLEKVLKEAPPTSMDAPRPESSFQTTIANVESEQPSGSRTSKFGTLDIESIERCLHGEGSGLIDGLWMDLLAE